MGRSEKRKPLDSFRDSLDDADALIIFAKAFHNQRSNKMRRELRGRLGDALRVPVRDRESMDCIENDQIFLVFRDASVLGKERFADLRPLLRQSIVAGCAALETYLADKTMERVGSALKGDAIPKRLRAIPLTLGHWADIERDYSRRTWGIRTIVDEAVREQASTAPNKVGELLSMIGVSDWTRKVDAERKVSRGTTEEELSALTERRNRVAHSADRVGQGRANLEIPEAEAFLVLIREVAEAINTVVDKHALGKRKV